MEKKCSKCREVKDTSLFNKHSKEPDGFYSQCKECSKKANREQYEKNPQKWKDYAKVWKKENKDKVSMSYQRHAEHNKKKSRENRIKKTYGITQEDYQRMYDEQNGLCAICGEPSIKNFHIDHDHKNKNVRGLLCPACNKALGFVKEDISILEKMMRYINGNKA
jgi:hypothetical protein